MKIFLIGVLVILNYSLKAQKRPDLQLYEKQLNREMSRVVYQPKPFINLKSKPAIIKYNPVMYLFGGLLYGYQNVISPQISAGCTFRPTCSQFAIDALKTTNMIIGLGLIADRLSRCTSCGIRDAAEPERRGNQYIIIDPPCCPK